jgi:hypothetical protein
MSYTRSHVVLIVASFLVMISSTRAYGQNKAMAGSFAAMNGAMGFLSAQSTFVNYGGTYSTLSETESLQQHRFGFQFPVFRGDTDTVAVSTNASLLKFSSAPVLSTGTRVNQDLAKLELGGVYSKKLEGDRLIGGRVGLGSASDQPFADREVTTFGMSAYYGFPNSDNDRWFITLFYSNNNPISNLLPIPGFIYLHFTKTFMGLFGVPFASITWMPSEVWTFSFSAFGPTINSEIAFGERQALQIFSGFNWSQQSFLRRDRVKNEDRVYFDEKRIFAGARLPVLEFIHSDLQVGYGFDRSIFEGSSYRNSDAGTKVFENSLYVSWNLKAGF